MKNFRLVIIFTTVGLAILYMGFFYHKHRQKTKAAKEIKQKLIKSHFDEVGSTFGGRKKRKLKK